MPLWAGRRGKALQSALMNQAAPLTHHKVVFSAEPCARILALTIGDAMSQAGVWWASLHRAANEEASHHRGRQFALHP